MPEGLTAQSVGATVTLTWTLPTGDNYPLTVDQSPATIPVPTYLGYGTTRYTADGLDPAVSYCFKVGAVLALGAAPRIEWSAPVCAKG